MSHNGLSGEKKAKLDEKVEETQQHKMSAIDDKVLQAYVEEIDNCQSEIDNLNEQAAEDILAVEVRYNELRKPHYTKRSEIISKVPEFWRLSFQNHPQLSPLFTEEELAVLVFMKNFFIEEFEDIKDGYKIILKFDPNPYFENDVLIKEFHLGSEEPRQVVTPIKWKPGKNFLNTPAVDKDSRKRKAPDSFFSWFTSSEPSPLDEMADWLKDELWPNPLQFFMMPSVEEDDDENEDAEDEDDEVDDGDSEESDDDGGSGDEICEN